MVLVMVIGGFALITVGASRLGAGTTWSFQGIWARPDSRDWPRGVQEADAPRFAIAHLDGLRPGTPVALSRPLDGDPEAPRPEIVELDAVTDLPDAGLRMPILAVRTEWLLR
jgi:hypothetical protein